MEATKDVKSKVQGFVDLPLKAWQEVCKRFFSFKKVNGGKYSRDNHLKPIKNTVLMDAVMRHWVAYMEGEDMDENDTSHLTAMALNCLMLEEQRLNGILIEDRLSVLSHNTDKS